MKKYFYAFSTLIFLILETAGAFDAVVIVLEAPLLKEPDYRSKILQTLRKGQRVYVPDEVLVNGDLPEFIPTFDRTGNRTYIPARYIKVITHNEAEYNQPITYEGHDPTDYRLEEPIPTTYPFSNNEYLRASLSMIIANNSQSAYAFEPSYDQQDLKNEIGARVVVTRKVQFDSFDRFYFGFLGIITNTENSTEYKNASTSSESRALYRGGPFLTYDAYKNENMRFSLGGGFTYNYHKSLVSIQNSEGLGEDRIFSGYSLSPVVNSTFQLASIVPNTDLIAGADLNFFLPHTQKAQNSAEITQLWSENDEIRSPLKVQASVFFGIQVKY